MPLLSPPLRAALALAAALLAGCSLVLDAGELSRPLPDDGAVEDTDSAEPDAPSPEPSPEPTPDTGEPEPEVAPEVAAEVEIDLPGGEDTCLVEYAQTTGSCPKPCGGGDRWTFVFQASMAGATSWKWTVEETSGAYELSLAGDETDTLEVEVEVPTPDPTCLTSPPAMNAGALDVTAIADGKHAGQVDFSFVPQKGSCAAASGCSE